MVRTITGIKPVGKTDALVLAIDVGTSGARSMIFNSKDGTRVASEYSEWNSFFPKSSWVEQDSMTWWRTVRKTCTAVLKRSGIPPERILGVSVTNQRETIVPVDSDCTPLHRAIVWQDRRSGTECSIIRDTLGDASVYKSTGLTIDPYFSLPKILWFKEHLPRVFKKTFKFCLVNDFVTHKLCGRFVTDHSNASRTMLFDIKRRKWSKRILGAFGIDESQLCTPVPSGTLVGHVSRQAALETGLCEGTAVVSGGGDQQCAALGVGAILEGKLKCTTGTGTFMLAPSKKPRLTDRRVLCSCHAIPGMWVVEASMFTTGSVLKWFKNNVFGGLAYSKIDALAGKAPSGSGGVLIVPHWIGAGAPYWDPAARGIIAGLTLGHTQSHLARAVMEGVAFETRKNAQIMGTVLGRKISQMRVSGGAAKSRVWNQILADVLGIPLITTAETEASALGAGILAACGCGIYGSVRRACGVMVRDREKVLPCRRAGESRVLYDKLYKIHSRLHDVMSAASVWKDLEGFQAL